ncbi:uncharacterized protein LOC143445226 isoform X2 [Clavelina lepadiformis]|uniref:uncharacterized protein LOC143445226 isoform X2 n=1 Tax=Clavelina lepadiformis TaxID=159417 RepID=UPI0040418F30
MSSVTYQCNVCDKQFATFCKLTRHRKTHKSIRFVCKLCDSSYKRKDYYRKHYRNKHAGNQLGIEDAFVKIEPAPGPTLRSSQNPEASDERGIHSQQPGTSHTNQGSEEHRNIAGDIRFLCELCDSSFSGKDSYQLYYRKKYTGNQLRIEDAFVKNDSTPPSEQATTRRSQSNATDREGSNERNEIYEADVVELERKIGNCKQCQHESDFIKNENYSQKKHICVICKETFSTATSLDCHMKSHISKKSVSNGQVSLMLSPTQQELTSTGEGNNYHQMSLFRKPFHFDWKSHNPILNVLQNEHLVSCKICKKYFSSESSLFTHMRIHAIYTYSCPLCQRKFIEKDQLEVHIFRHEGKRLFSSSLCDMSSIRKEEVKQHLACHASDNLENV